MKYEPRAALLRVGADEPLQQQGDARDRHHAVERVQLHAGGERQEDERQRDQEERHQVVLPFLGAAGVGADRQADGAEEGRQRQHAAARPRAARRAGRPRWASGC